MAMNPFGVNLDALQMMSNPLLRGFASQQQEEEEPVGFWNKIASRMPGYNLPGMQNDMKRQALNEALIMAGASMMQNAGSGNIGSAIAEALTKGMGTYKEGVSSQYQGLQEQRKREMEDFERMLDNQRIALTGEEVRLRGEENTRAGEKHKVEMEEIEKNKESRDRERRIKEIEQERALNEPNVDLSAVLGSLLPEELRLVEAERDLNGPAAALSLARDLYDKRKKRELDERDVAAREAYYKPGGRANSSRNEIPTSIVNKLYASAQNAMKELNQVLAKPPLDVSGNKTKEVAWRNTKTSEILGKYGWDSEEEVAAFLSDYKARGGIGSAEEMPGLAYANPEFEAKRKELERLIGVAKASGRAGLKAEGLEDSDIDKVMMIAGVR